MDTTTQPRSGRHWKPVINTLVADWRHITLDERARRWTATRTCG